jgi:hypothetical protein
VQFGKSQASILSYDHWQPALNSSFRFPGSQPVSFGVKDLAKLENQE